ncbi:MAG: TetR/AcrR family transcriptional regulator [Tepidiformaceae bacterium]
MTAVVSLAGATREPDVRDRIFGSALRRFSHQGYAATSLREIADDAHTTKPMIYYYFGSKEGLYGIIVREILGKMAAALRERIPGAAPFSERILAYCEAYMGYFLEEEESIGLVLREVFGLGGVPMDEFANTLGEQVRLPLDEILRDGIASGATADEDVFGCATALTGIMNMFILSHVFGGVGLDSERPINQVRHFVAGLEAHR